MKFEVNYETNRPTLFICSPQMQQLMKYRNQEAQKEMLERSSEEHQENGAVENRSIEQRRMEIRLTRAR